MKLYRDLFTDYPFICLSDPAKLLFVGLIIVASEQNNSIPLDGDFLRKRLNFAMVSFDDPIEELLSAGIIEVKGVPGRPPSASTISDHAPLETERETEGEKNPPNPRGGTRANARRSAKAERRKQAVEIVEGWNQRHDRVIQRVDSTLKPIIAQATYCCEHHTNPRPGSPS